MSSYSPVIGNTREEIPVSNVVVVKEIYANNIYLCCSAYVKVSNSCLHALAINCF